MEGSADDPIEDFEDFEDFEDHSERERKRRKVDAEPTSLLPDHKPPRKDAERIPVPGARPKYVSTGVYGPRNNLNGQKASPATSRGQQAHNKPKKPGRPLMDEEGSPYFNKHKPISNSAVAAFFKNNKIPSRRVAGNARASHPIIINADITREDHSPTRRDLTTTSNGYLDPTTLVSGDEEPPQPRFPHDRPKRTVVPPSPTGNTISSITMGSQPDTRKVIGKMEVSDSMDIEPSTFTRNKKKFDLRQDLREVQEVRSPSPDDIGDLEWVRIKSAERPGFTSLHDDDIYWWHMAVDAEKQLRTFRTKRCDSAKGKRKPNVYDYANGYELNLELSSVTFDSEKHRALIHPHKKAPAELDTTLKAKRFIHLEFSDQSEKVKFKAQLSDCKVEEFWGTQAYATQLKSYDHWRKASESLQKDKSKEATASSVSHRANTGAKLQSEHDLDAANNEYHIGHIKKNLERENRQQARRTRSSKRSNSPLFTQNTEELLTARYHARTPRPRKKAIRSYMDVSDEDELSKPAPRPRVRFQKGEKWSSPLVYPPTGRNRAVVDFEDLDRMNEGEFLNDNLINFFIKYTEREMKPVDEPDRFYFFNTYFYGTMNRRSDKSDFESLMKWTKGEDLFKKDFVFIPINENAHWYLAVICNLNRIDRKLEEAPTLSQEDEAEPSNVVQNVQSPALSKEEDTASRTSSRKASPELGDITPEGKASRDSGDQTMEIEAPVAHGTSTENPINLDSQAKSTTGDNTQQEDTTLDVTSASNSDTKPEKELIDMTESPAPTKPKSKKDIPLDSPMIIILDSLLLKSQNHAVKQLREYLSAEAKDKRGMNLPADTETIRSMYAEVPKQENYCDCGVYVLHYIDRFLEMKEAAIEFLLRSRMLKSKKLRMTDDELKKWHQEQDRWSVKPGRRRELFDLVKQTKQELDIDLGVKKPEKPAVAGGMKATNRTAQATQKVRISGSTPSKPIASNPRPVVPASPVGKTPEKASSVEEEAEKNSEAVLPPDEFIAAPPGMEVVAPSGMEEPSSFMDTTADYLSDATAPTDSMDLDSVRSQAPEPTNTYADDLQNRYVCEDTESKESEDTDMAEAPARSSASSMSPRREDLEVPETRDEPADGRLVQTTYRSPSPAPGQEWPEKLPPIEFSPARPVSRPAKSTSRESTATPEPPIRLVTQHRSSPDIRAPFEPRSASPGSPAPSKAVERPASPGIPVPSKPTQKPIKKKQDLTTEYELWWSNKLPAKDERAEENGEHRKKSTSYEPEKEQRPTELQNPEVASPPVSSPLSPLTSPPRSLNPELNPQAGSPKPGTKPEENETDTEIGQPEPERRSATRTPEEQEVAPSAVDSGEESDVVVISHNVLPVKGSKAKKTNAPVRTEVGETPLKRKSGRSKQSHRERKS